MIARERPGRDVIGVADLARRLKRSVEGLPGGEWIEGEIVSLKRAASGHVYFTLKDSREEAALECVMYRMDAAGARQHLVAGAGVQVTARATLWVPRGRLQLVAQRVRPVGLGSLLEQIERLKRRLQAEGLFDAERKRALPDAPRFVGVITSSHGAALHDVRSVAFRRGRVVLVLVSALVQGDGAPDSLLQALDRMRQDTRIQVVIVGRGGGAGEDLMAFNDERVVRCLADFPLPVVSAVGHEVDTTLADLVADVRAATPSQAAELVVPELAPRLERLATLRRQIARAMRVRLAEDRGVLRQLRTRLGDPRFSIADRQQGLDELVMRAERSVRAGLAEAAERRKRLAERLLARHPRVVVLRSRATLVPLDARLRSALRDRLVAAQRRWAALQPALGRGARSRWQIASERLRFHQARLEALSPLTVLGRGYSIVMNAEGRVVTDAEELATDDVLRVRLHRGSLRVSVVGALTDANPADREAES